MSKVTSKLQITLPKAIADRFMIKPGDNVDWEAGNDAIRIVPARTRAKSKGGVQDRLKHFDRATQRQRQREKTLDPAVLAAAAREGRGWTRADLYDRGDAR